MLVSSTPEVDSPMYSPTREWRRPFMTGESFWTTGSRFTDFKEHTTIFKGTIILKTDCRLLLPLRSCNVCLKKLPEVRDFNRLPGVLSLGCQLKIRVTPRIYEKI
jgi:hypothetical protein